jgi:MoxR-like ATPase
MIQETIKDIQSELARKSEKYDTDSGLKHVMSTLEAKIDLVRAESTKTQAIDPRLIQTQVTDLIATAFEPFKQAVQSAGAEAVIADMSSVRVIERKNCMETFGVDLPFEFDIYNHPNTPAVDPNFIWTEDILRSLAFAQATGSNVWLGGLKGTGKSETARQFSARTGRGFTRINFHKYSTASEYIGDVGLTNGQTTFKQGDFLQAYTCPSSVILLDEVSNCSEGELAPLNAFLEPNPIVNYGGQAWRKAQGVLVIGADNTLLSGDPSGLYGGTKAMNVAFGERFSLVVEFTHMDKSIEIQAVMRHTGCSKALANHVIDAFRLARSKVETGDVIDSPSIRQVLAFIRALPYMSTAKAWETTVCARQPVESATALKAIGNATLNEQTIRGAL